jgi:hypothetical protein
MMGMPLEKNHELKRQLTFKDGTILNASRKIGIGYDRLIAIISGRTQPNNEEIQRIVKHLNVKLFDLFPNRYLRSRRDV